MTPKMLKHLQCVMTVGLVQHVMTAVGMIGSGQMAAAGHIPIGMVENQIMREELKIVLISTPVVFGMTCVVTLCIVHYAEMKVLYICSKAKKTLKSLSWYKLASCKTKNHVT